MTTRERVYLSLLATEGSRTEAHGVYPDRRNRVRRAADVKAAPMRPAGVRKMRQSRKRRKPANP